MSNSYKRVDAHLSSLGYCTRSEAKKFLRMNEVCIKDNRVYNTSIKAYHDDIKINGEVLDDEAIDKIIKAKNFQSSMATVRQVEFALFDFKVHQKLYKTEDEVQKILNSVRNEFSVMIPPSYNKFQNGFSHIFSGGYAAG